MDPRRTRQLLACGIAAPIVYLALDLACSALAPAYRWSDMTVSELSAIDAPTRPLWVAGMTLVYEPLQLLFALGVWRAAGTRWRLRVSALLLLAIALVGLAWPPMHLRGEPTSLTDTLHIVWTAVFALLSLTTMALAAGALRRAFRLYAIVSIAAIVAAGAITGAMSGPIPAGGATPWIGVVERISVYGWAAWMVVLAFALRRERALLPSPRAPGTRALRTGTTAAAAP